MQTQAGKVYHTMLTLDEALELCRTEPVPPVVTESLPVEAAVGRVLPGAVSSPIDSPPFDKATMDGYAVFEETLQPGTSLQVRATIAAGQSDIPPDPATSGTCVRIMTGAPVPAGAVQVIRREYVREEESSITVTTPETGRNIVGRGAHIQAGQTVLQPKVLAPADSAILAGLGLTTVTVARSPRIALITTGSELASPGQPLAPGQIYDSNGTLLSALIRETRCPLCRQLSVSDDPESIQVAIGEALAHADVLLVTGGVSAGDFDHVPEALAQAGVQTIFHRMAFKPGKPLLFGRKETRHVFALPGNPQAVFALWTLFVRPHILQRQGITEPERIVSLVAREPIPHTDPSRSEMVLLALNGGQVEPVPSVGSSHLEALAHAQAWAIIPAGAGDIAAGDMVDARLL